MSEGSVQTIDQVKDRVASGQLENCLVEEVDMSSVGLPGVRAADATFRKVALHHADATGSDLSRVRFAESSCRGVDFTGALLRGCSFFSSEFIEANFAGSTMSGTSFFSTRLTNAELSGSRIQSGTFNSCELFGIRFARSLLVNTRFEAQERGNVTLDRADFSNAILVDCDLLGSNLFAASFENALLVKVDLRQANLAQANFKGARLIDVQVDLNQLEPGERRIIENARIDDPWRAQGFMREILEPHSPAELFLLVEYLMRTYVIEGAQPTSASDTFPGVLASIKARYDFPELDHLRVRGTAIQVRHGSQWYDLGAPIAVEAGSGAPAPSPVIEEEEAPAPAPARTPSAPATSASSPAAVRKAEEQAPPPSQAPKNVKRSKRFRKLEID